MLSIASKANNIAEVIKLRLMIFILFYLTLEFGRVFIMAGVSAHPLMAMWGTIFFELTAIIIFNLLYGTTNVGRDINTFNFYGVGLHVLYIPFYCYGIDLSSYHNNASKCINMLIVLRLLLPFPQQLLQRIALVEFAKVWFHQHRLFLNKYINGLTISIFILCALPLFTLIYFINTDQMRITGIAIVLFAFFIAIESSQPKQAIKADASELAAAPQKTSSSDAQTEIAHLRTMLKLLLVALALSAAAFFITAGKKKESMFMSGYAAGYHDGKSGAPPKTTMRLGKMLYCQLVYDPSESRDYGQGDHECDPNHFDKK